MKCLQIYKNFKSYFFKKKWYAGSKVYDNVIYSYEMREWKSLTQWSQLKCCSCYNSFLMGCSFSSMLFCGIFLLFFSVLIIIVINFILTFFFYTKMWGQVNFDIFTFEQLSVLKNHWVNIVWIKVVFSVYLKGLKCFCFWPLPS